MPGATSSSLTAKRSADWEHSADRDTRIAIRDTLTGMADYAILQHFTFKHLPADLVPISEPFCSLAYDMAERLPHNAETSTALRKLLEAKDAAVRSAVESRAGV